MNTRVQVEHPVRAITGIDIVKEQIWVAFKGASSDKMKCKYRDYAIILQNQCRRPVLIILVVSTSEWVHIPVETEPNWFLHHGWCNESLLLDLYAWKLIVHEKIRQDL